MFLDWYLELVTDISSMSEDLPEPCRCLLGQAGSMLKISRSLLALRPVRYSNILSSAILWHVSFLIMLSIQSIARESTVGVMWVRANVPR